MVKEIKARSALNRLKRKVPYAWDLNIYRGCAHNCHYCYAMYSHEYLNMGDFFGDVFAKVNIALLLDRELSSPSWKGEVINIGGVTDSYQSAEEELGIMRQVLKVMLKHRNPIIISTKSDLILRDLDLLGELSKYTYVNIAATIITMDEEIREIYRMGGADKGYKEKLYRIVNRLRESYGLSSSYTAPQKKKLGKENADILSNAKPPHINTTHYKTGVSRDIA
ncbi:MAG: hypothetical protein KAV40_00550 [Thermoplasmatales archaeon]|nr:hypothetical protein [Thermoplasmatales archaeon]